MEDEMKRIQRRKLAGHMLYPTTAYPPILMNLGQVQGHEVWPPNVVAEYGGPYPSVEMEPKPEPEPERQPTEDELRTYLRALEGEAKIKGRLKYFTERMARKLAFLGQVSGDEIAAAKALGISLDCGQCEKADKCTAMERIKFKSKGCQWPCESPLPSTSKLATETSTISLFRSSGLTQQDSIESIVEIKDNGTGESIAVGGASSSERWTRLSEHGEEVKLDQIICYLGLPDDEEEEDTIPLSQCLARVEQIEDRGRRCSSEAYEVTKTAAAEIERLAKVLVAKVISERKLVDPNRVKKKASIDQFLWTNVDDSNPSTPSGTSVSTRVSESNASSQKASKYETRIQIEEDAQVPKVSSLESVISFYNAAQQTDGPPSVISFYDNSTQTDSEFDPSEYSGIEEVIGSQNDY